MKALIIGQNTKIANVFSYFCEEVAMAGDKKIDTYRSYSENSRFRQLETVVDIRSAKSILPRCLEIRRWVKETGANVVFTNDKYSMIAAKLAQMTMRRKFKHLSTSHNSYAWLNEGNVRKFARLIALTCNGYVSMATFAYEGLLKAGINKRELILLPNALETGLFKPKQSYEMPAGECRLVYAAAVYPGKCQDVAIKVVAELRRRGIKATLDLFGDVCDEDYFNSLKKQVADSGLEDAVTFHGRVANELLREELHKYNIYICPTKMEMSPFNILEAQQAGLPLVASRVGGIPDLVENRRNGILCEWGNVKEFCDAIMELAHDRDLREALGTGALRWVNEENTPQHAAEQMKRFITSL